MTATNFHETFRAQLVLPELRHFFDYWVGLADGRKMPDRKDVNPASIPRHLPHVSLIDIETDPLNFRYRLAGSQLRDVYQKEVTGMSLREFSENEKRDYWLSACERIFQTGRPAQGVLRGPELPRDHMVQFWLRLPLTHGGDEPAMILGLDKCISVSAASSAQQIWDGKLRSNG